jgi:hypothetical protein
MPIFNHPSHAEPLLGHPDHGKAPFYLKDVMEASQRDYHSPSQVQARSAEAAILGDGPADWKFTKIPDGTRQWNATLSNDFKAAHAVNVVVREAIQNAMDARRYLASTHNLVLGVATVRFTFKRIAFSALKALGLETALAHVLSQENTAATQVNLIPKFHFNSTVNVLLVEDDGTGLKGESEFPRGGVIESPAQKYLFEVGSASTSRAKKGNQGGRHGVGAECVTLASKCRCAYVHSTDENGVSFATGRTTITNHTLDEQNYQGLGTYATARLDDGIGPCKGGAADAVHKTCQFERPIDEPGFSAAIIEPLNEINYESMLASILTTQFFQIATGQLVVILRDDRNGREITIDAENIRELIADDAVKALVATGVKSANKVRAPADKARRHFEIFHHLPSVLDVVDRLYGQETAPIARLDDREINFLSEAEQDLLRSDWNQGRVVRFTVPMEALKQVVDEELEHEFGGSGGESVSGNAEVAMLQVDAMPTGYDIHVRDNIVMVEERKKQSRISITRVADDGFAGCIGDCEDPSHTAFKATYGIDRGWNDPAAAISQFKSLVNLAAQRFAGQATETDTTSLSHFFPLNAGSIQAHRRVSRPLPDGEDGLVVNLETPTPVDDVTGDESSDPVLSPSTNHYVNIIPDAREGSVTFVLKDGILPEGETADVEIVLAFATNSRTNVNRKRTPFYAPDVGFARAMNCGKVVQSEDKSRFDIKDVQAGFTIAVTGLGHDRDPYLSVSLHSKGI